MVKWIEKKDLVYWLLIVLLIWLLSSDYGKRNPVVLDNWSFASTIVSIILAVLAIVYTFAQSATTFYSTNKLEESANKIEDVSTKLEEISVDAIFQKIEENMMQLEEKIGTVIHSVDDSVGKHFQASLSPLTELLSSYSIESNNQELDDFQIFTREQWISYFKSTKGFIREALVYIYYLHQEDLTKNIRDYVDWLEQEDELKNKLDMNIDTIKLHIYLQLHYSILVFNSLNVYTLRRTKNTISVNELSPNFLGAMEELIVADSGKYSRRVSAYINDLYEAEDVNEPTSNK